LGFSATAFIANRWMAFASLAASKAARMQLPGQQFHLQDLHYRKFFPETDRRIVTIDEQPVARFYLPRGGPKWMLR